VRESYFLELFLKNPFVVELFNTFIDNNHLFIVTEYCSGGNMRSFLENCTKQGKWLSKETVYAWTVQLVIGVSDIHRQMVAHRDLKPENLFLRDNHNVLVIGDLGESKLMIDPSATFVGTPLYMSPELHLHQPYTLATDVWSIGCILYQMCMGHPPYGGCSIDEISSNIASEVPLETIPAEWYGAEMSELVHSMLEKDVSKRPSLLHIVTTNTWFKEQIVETMTLIQSARTESTTTTEIATKTTRYQSDARRISKSIAGIHISIPSLEPIRQKQTV